ncbi:MAG TPA: tRNA (guanosine(46)-N7)-methyltransferase TrmB, partial [Pseudoxanthomonas sp.]|nr:tRNA (guanosine(46)-N7)-methyltransferase TrmB [Pseudoxanthomonas sp.]
MNDPYTWPHIRSFVLRQGRVSNAQRRAVETLLPTFGIAYAPAPLDLDAAFGRPAPKILEIGFGMGETPAKIAASNPHNDYLGIEVHTPGVG